MSVNFLDLIAGTSVDLKGLEEGLKKAEAMAESTAKKIASSMGLIGVGIATAVAGAALVALEEAVKKTAEWGLEMEHLSNRMGMTVRETATMVGIMERFGVNANMGARAMQMLSQQVHQTQNSLDPFSTRLGKVLGSLRDTSGHAMNMAQVMDLVRQKVSGASTDSEKLQIATSLLGARIGGQLVPMLKLSNEEWERQKASVQATLGPVEKAAELALAYKQATAELQQTFRGLQVALGAQLLPTVIDLVHSMTALVSSFGHFREAHPMIMEFIKPWAALKAVIDGVAESAVWASEKVGLVGKGTLDSFKHQDQYKEAARQAALETEKTAEEAARLDEEIEQSIQNERKLVAEVQQHVKLLERARALGVETGGSAAEQVELEKALTKFTEQRLFLESKASDKGLTPDQREKLETDILKNRVDAAQLVTDYVMKGYKEEELQLKANGAMSLAKEIELLQKKLSDEHIVGDERLKIEAEVYQKRQSFLEESLKLGRQLGFVSVDDEINYRKQKTLELLGKGDVTGAGQELVKARNLAIQQADQVMEFTKKIRIVSLQDEINYQKQKLALVKGNAEEEMKVLSHIADLDKQLYDRRLQFALDYNQKAIDSYRAMLKATGQKDTTISKPEESLTFAQREREAERARFENARMVEQVAMHGGTESEISSARKAAEENKKEIEDAQAIGKSASEGMKELAKAGKDFFSAAMGGEEARAPGGPSPITGSLLSPTEGLATSTLARGSDIPRLDTSFTDLAIRVRDVLNGTIAPLQNFSNQLTQVTRQMAALSNVPNNPGAVGPGGGTTSVPFGTPPPTGFGVVSGPPVTAGPGAQQPVAPTGQPAVTSVTSSNPKLDALLDAIHTLPDKLQTALLGQNAANAESLQSAINQVLSKQPGGVSVQIGIDANTGDLIVNRLVQELSAP